LGVFFRQTCFNPRARGGRDGIGADNMTGGSGFNPRARGGRDGGLSTPDPHPARFNPRARGGRDPSDYAVVAQSTMFQSTRPRGRDRNMRTIGQGRICFNPRARGGRDDSFADYNVWKSQFQSTRPRGARLRRHKLFACQLMVSIHAPAGGATRPIKSSGTFRALFQSTRPRGARRGVFSSQCSTACFNPRARGGRDASRSVRLSYWQQFQSTRPRGARPKGKAPAQDGTSVSIHAPAGGATTYNRKARQATQGFNPRARGGRDMIPA